MTCLYPLIPFISYEIYETWNFETDLRDMTWPDFSKVSHIADEVTVAVQILGKLRGTITVPANSNQDYIVSEVEKLSVYEKYIEGKNVKKIIYVPNKIINYVVM